jgi:hypothetical protein
MSIQDLTAEGARYRPVLDTIGKGTGIHFPPIPLTPREQAVALRPSEWMAIRFVSFDDTRPNWPGYLYYLINKTGKEPGREGNGKVVGVGGGELA